MCVSKGCRHDGRNDWHTNNHGSEDHVHHLFSILRSTSLNEVVCVVGSGKWFVGYGLAEIFAEWSPAGADSVFEKLARWDQVSDLFVVVVKPVLAPVLEIVVEKVFPEIG